MTLNSGLKATKKYDISRNLMLLLFLLVQLTPLLAQNKPAKSNRLGRELGVVQPKDSASKPLPKVTDYLIISSENDTTYVDTTLSIKKDYKFNYLRKDDFGLMPFSNMG